MPAETIKNRVNAWRSAWLCLRSAGVMLDCLSAALWLSAVTAGAAILFGLTREQRLLLMVFAAAWIFWRFTAGFAAFLPDLRLMRFGAMAEAALPGMKGRLLSALELSGGVLSPGASPAFAGRHLEDAAALLKSSPRPAFISLRTILPPARLAWLASGFCAAAAVALSDPGAFYWFLRPLALRPLEDVMEIAPGNHEITRGRPFKIEAVFRNGGEGGPELFLDGSAGASGRVSGKGGISGPWARGFMTAAGRGRFVYAGASLDSDLAYRLEYKELQSSVYLLKAAEPPALKDILFSVTPPAYTGEKGPAFPYLPPESEVLAGSRINISGAPAGEILSASLMFASGGELPFRAAGGRLEAEFTPSRGAAYRLALKQRDGEPQIEGPYSIRVLEDSVPAVKILSPAFGALEAAPEEELPAVYEASDDVGLREIRLRRKVQAGGKPVPGLSFDKKIKVFSDLSARFFSGETRLEIYDLPDGTEAAFSFSACDRSPAAACGDSGTVRIKVTDFSARHASAYAGLDALKKEVGALKNSEDGIIADLDKGRVFTAEEMAAYEAAWRKAAASAERLGKELGHDPYMASGTLARYGSFEDDMAYGARTARQKAVPETLAGPAARAAQTHKTLSGLLAAGERGLEAGLRSEDARSSSFGFEGMARNASDMAGKLSLMAQAPGDDAEWAKFERTVEKINAELSRIRELLKDRPPKKSDGRTFALPAGEALDTAAELASAIKARNPGKAAALAAGLAEKLSQMRRVMEEYASYQASSDGSRGEREKASELSVRWKELYDAQSAETSAGREMSDALLVKIDRARAARLAEMSAAPAVTAKSLYASRLEAPAAFSAAQRADDRLKAGDVEAAGAALGNVLTEIKKSTCVPCAPALRAAESGARDVLDRIARLGSDQALLEPADLALFPPAALREEKVKRESEDLSAYIAGNYSGAMAGGLMERLEKAGLHMAKAAQALNEGSIRPAAEEQLKALDELELGDRFLDDMMKKMDSAESGMDASSKPSAVFTRPASGLDPSPVKLPKPGDYTPPAELREKVMDSLKERYPASQKELIDDYLKNVAK